MKTVSNISLYKINMLIKIIINIISIKINEKAWITNPSTYLPTIYKTTD